MQKTATTHAAAIHYDVDQNAPSCPFVVYIDPTSRDTLMQFFADMVREYFMGRSMSIKNITTHGHRIVIEDEKGGTTICPLTLEEYYGDVVLEYDDEAFLFVSFPNKHRHEILNLLQLPPRSERKVAFVHPICRLDEIKGMDALSIAKYISEKVKEIESEASIARNKGYIFAYYHTTQALKGIDDLGLLDGSEKEIMPFRIINGVVMDWRLYSEGLDGKTMSVAVKFAEMIVDHLEVWT